MAQPGRILTLGFFLLGASACALTTQSDPTPSPPSLPPATFTLAPTFTPDAPPSPAPPLVATPTQGLPPAHNPTSRPNNLPPPSVNLPPTMRPAASATPPPNNPPPPNDSGAPRLPATITARPIFEVAGRGLVSAQATLSLEVGVVMDADRVRYFVGTSANDPTPINFATDNDPFDGTAVLYTFNSFDSVLWFWAVAEKDALTSRTQALSITYDPTYNPNPTGVSITPALGFDGNIYTLQYGASVVVSWAAAPTNAARVEFYVTGWGLIGTDFTPGDGANILWTVPPWVLGQISAVAVYPDGRTSASLPLNVYSEGEGVRPSP